MVNDINSGKDAAVSGLGIVILPNLATEEELKHEQLVQLLAALKLSIVDLYAVFHSREWIPIKVKNFLEFLYR